MKDLYFSSGSRLQDDSVFFVPSAAVASAECSELVVGGATFAALHLPRSTLYAVDRVDLLQAVKQHLA